MTKDAAVRHQIWCQYQWCLKCGTSREYHEEGPMTSHGFVPSECACGVVTKQTVRWQGQETTP